MNWRDGIIQSSSRREAALDSAQVSGMLFEPTYAGCHKMKWLIKPALPLATVSICLFGYVLNSKSGIFREYEAALLSVQWMLLICLAVWSGTFLFLTFSMKDLPLIGLLLVAIAAYSISQAENRPAIDAITLLFGVTLGKGARFALKADGRSQVADGENHLEIRSSEFGVRSFLVGLVLLLAFASWWHLDMTNNVYHGPRWMGLWNNPNDYGLLMGAGVVLAAGMLAERLKAKGERLNEGENLKYKKLKAEIKKRELVVRSRQSVVGDQKSLRSLRSFAAKIFGLRRRRGDESYSDGGKSVQDSSRRLLLRPLPIILCIAAFMLGTGLVFSYSRGAWVGTSIGLLYLAWSYGKFKWRWVLPPALVALAVACLFWNNTPDNASWIEKRLDLGRASAQHRVAAWKAGFEIMRDHPFGVGWNKAVETYQNNYSPPEDGAAAITTNDYLMLGTQLGVPGLLCFVAYVALCFRGRARHSVRAGLCGQSPGGGQGTARPTLDSLQAACRAGALAMLVAFWFDGGLFKLATTSVFWILLELGAGNQKRKAESGKAETKLP